jgi:predicted metal-dependent hydrolase
MWTTTMEASSAATREALGRGRRLFNAGQFFEAHEVWEEAWLREEGETRQLLQGLIQVAAGYHQAFDRRHAHGCAWLLEAGWNRLQTLAGGAGGLALAPFREGVSASLEKARAWERGDAVGLEAGDAPRLRLSTQ